MIDNQPHGLRAGRCIVLRWHDLPILSRKGVGTKHGAIHFPCRVVADLRLTFRATQPFSAIIAAMVLSETRQPFSRSSNPM
ncbi:hypothetical protein, partial [Nocardia amamiensis]|uniref:hypothetical protein n=1 Tax=Nocardia amamiensis TaxID=404578 RepID=UPI001E2F2511